MTVVVIANSIVVCEHLKRIGYMNKTLLKGLALGIDWIFKKPEDVDRKKVDAYIKYERQVMNRAAHSIGCSPDDLRDKEHLILDMYLDGLDQFQAAIQVEHSLQGECYYYNKVLPFINEKAPF